MCDGRGTEKGQIAHYTNNKYTGIASLWIATREQYKQTDKETYTHTHSHTYISYKKDLNVIYNAIIQEININGM